MSSTLWLPAAGARVAVVESAARVSVAAADEAAVRLAPAASAKAGSHFVPCTNFVRLIVPPVDAACDARLSIAGSLLLLISCEETSPLLRQQCCCRVHMGWRLKRAQVTAAQCLSLIHI